MTIREVLDKLKRELEEIQPSVGRIHATLRMSPKPDDVLTDYKVEDADMGGILKVVIVRPGEGNGARSTTGGSSGYWIESQNIVIMAIISAMNDGAPDLVLEETIERVKDRMRRLTRLKSPSEQFPYLLGQMRWTPVMASKLSNHDVLVKELTLQVQDRKGG